MSGRHTLIIQLLSFSRNKMMVVLKVMLVMIVDGDDGGGDDGGGEDGGGGDGGVGDGDDDRWWC